MEQLRLVNFPYVDSHNINEDLVTSYLRYDFANFDEEPFNNCSSSNIMFSEVYLNMCCDKNKFDVLSGWINNLNLNHLYYVYLKLNWYECNQPLCVLMGYNVVNFPRSTGKSRGVCLMLFIHILVEVI